MRGSRTPVIVGAQRAGSAETRAVSPLDDVLNRQPGSVEVVDTPRSGAGSGRNETPFTNSFPTDVRQSLLTRAPDDQNQLPPQHAPNGAERRESQSAVHGDSQLRRLPRSAHTEDSLIQPCAAPDGVYQAGGARDENQLGQSRDENQLGQSCDENQLGQPREENQLSQSRGETEHEQFVCHVCGKKFMR